MTLQIRIGYRISRVEVVRRALSDIAGEMKMNRLPEGVAPDEENDDVRG